MKKLILLFAFLTASTMMFAQLYEIPLNRKIDESQLIVTGKVIESQSYTGKDDKILHCTQNCNKQDFQGNGFQGETPYNRNEGWSG